MRPATTLMVSLVIPCGTTLSLTVPIGQTFPPMTYHRGNSNSRQSTPIKDPHPAGIYKPSSVAKRLARHFTFGRSRVLTTVPHDQMWNFFRGFPTPSHRGMSHITDKANAGSVLTSAVPTTFLLPPSTPYPSRIFPSMWLKRHWKTSTGRLPSGGMKDVSFPFRNLQ
jgi:hypothetical protein